MEGDRGIGAVIAFLPQIVLLFVLRRFGGVSVGTKPVQVLVNIVRVTLLINLLMVASELFTELYSGGSHTASGHYLFFGLDGAHALVPWIWSAGRISVAICGGELLAAAIAAAPSLATDLASGEVRTQADIGRARPSMSEVSGAL